MTSLLRGAAGDPGTPGPLLLSVSGMGRLTHCEEKFLRTRAQPGRDSAGYGATLGTLLHLLVRETMFTRDWRAEYTRLLALEPGWSDEWEAPEHFLHAHWLMERYEQVYVGPQPWTMSAELPFDLPLPGMEGEVRVRGYFDGLDNSPPLKRGEDPASRPHGLHLDEIKSMGRWGKANRATWEPQLPTYEWAAREMGLPVTGVLFRAIGTMHSRTAKKIAPPADSFRDVWVPYDQAQIDKVLDDYRRAGRRGLHIIEHPEDAMRNPGEACGWCPFKVGCVLPERPPR